MISSQSSPVDIFTPASVESAGSDICSAVSAHMLTKIYIYIYILSFCCLGGKKELSAPVISVVLQCMLLFLLQISY